MRRHRGVDRRQREAVREEGSHEDALLREQADRLAELLTVDHRAPDIDLAADDPEELDASSVVRETGQRGRPVG